MAVRKKYDKSVIGRGLDDMGIGRGLDALIDTSDVKTQGSSNLNEIPIEQIEPNPDQPRREFDEQSMQELAASIQTMGIIAPITLRQVAPDRYQIIAGERRWRASQRAGLKAIPAYIRTVDDENVMELALVENIQREDLNAIEIALAYEHLAETTGMTQEKISERVGKSRTAVTNYMRLLKLPAQIQMSLKNHEIDMGHARALLALDSPSPRRAEESVQRAEGGGNGADAEAGRGRVVGKEENLCQGSAAQVDGGCPPASHLAAWCQGAAHLLGQRQGQDQHSLCRRGRAGKDYGGLRPVAAYGLKEK